MRPEPWPEIKFVGSTRDSRPHILHFNAQKQNPGTVHGIYEAIHARALRDHTDVTDTASGPPADSIELSVQYAHLPGLRSRCTSAAGVRRRQGDRGWHQTDLVRHHRIPQEGRVEGGSLAVGDLGDRFRCRREFEEAK